MDVNVKKRLRIAISTLGVLIALLPAPALAGSRKTWATISDVGAYGLAGVAIGVPVVNADKQGAFQAIGSLAANVLLVNGLKEAFPEIRPDGSNNKSFPSGHTSLAFASAATLYNRQGKGAGIPAFAVATLVGIARVEAKKHFWYDAAIGAGIGAATGFLITHKRPESQTAFVPWGDTKGAGFTLVKHF
jgi:membrane-associated phospholipid phosphatase